MQEINKDNEEKTLVQILEETIDHSGIMLSFSKRAYMEKHKDNKVYFNGCIYVIDGGVPKQVWWGDIDITLSKNKLQEVANKSGHTLYVTPEHPFRSDFNKPTIKDLNSEYVVKFEPITKA